MLQVSSSASHKRERWHEKRKRKVTEAAKDIVETCMRQNDKFTATQIHSVLASEGYHLSSRTVLCRTDFAWTYCDRAYCQVIREVNKARRIEWAWANVGCFAYSLNSIIVLSLSFNAVDKAGVAK